MRPDVQEWFRFSRNDLDVAKHLRDSFHPLPIEIICYHCQQSAEKAIKALFLVFEIPGGIPKKHDLSFLLKQIRHRVSVSDELFGYADMLNTYAAVVRYPYETRIGENSVESAILYAEAIYDWAESAADP